MYGGQHWFGGGFMWIFWIILIAAIFWGAKIMSSNKSNKTNNQNSALDILNDRYAKGEIEQTEFEQKRKDLMNKTG